MAVALIDLAEAEPVLGHRQAVVRTLLEEAAALLDTLGKSTLEARVMMRLAHVKLSETDLEGTTQLATRARDRFASAAEDRWRVLHCKALLARIAIRRDDLAGAQAALTELDGDDEDEPETLDARRAVAQLVLGWSELAVEQRNYAEADKRLAVLGGRFHATPAHLSARSGMQMRFLSFTVVLAACGGSGSDGPPDGPHAMGSITVIEAHATTGGNASSTVAAGFIPDAAAAPKQCTKTVAGCEIALTPDCGNTCGAKQYCAFDTGCMATCKATCDSTCAANEECYFPTPTTSGCRARQSFDAGTLTISGTTTPVTLFPPYSFKGIDSGSLFNDGAALSVTASGATTAGYQTFSESFTATRLFRTEPGLDKLGITDVFGTANIPIRWTAGQDTILVTGSVIAKSGKFGTFTCKADDTTGKFDVPRDAIKAVLAANDPLDRLTLSVTRSKVQSTYDLTTMGMLPGTEVQPVGWLDLTTSSTETTAFEGCTNGEQVCGNSCVDTSTNAHCGSCEHACATGDTCEIDTCSGATACASCVNSASTGSGVCASAYTACANNADCAALTSCLAACTDTTCQQNCSNAHPNSITLYNSGPNCICQSGCPTECSAQCNN